MVWRSATNEQPRVASAPPTGDRQLVTSARMPTVPAGMVDVPGGQFMMGRDDGDEYERPAHNVTVQPFFIDQYEVTNEDYAKFVKATNHRAPSNWMNGNYSTGLARRPVTDVTWDGTSLRISVGWPGRRPIASFVFP